MDNKSVEQQNLELYNAMMEDFSIRKKGLLAADKRDSIRIILNFIEVIAVVVIAIFLLN